MQSTDLLDFNWALTEKGVRSEIYYAGVTAEDKTSELLEYRKDWVYRDENNQERAYITFRDYCEWINVFAHDDAYKMDRGDLVDGQVSPDAWLTIESYAVWKRMEKYENNTVYIAKSGNTSGVLEIKAPILKRQISTTIFPRIYSSGKAVNADGVTEIGKEPTLPSNLKKEDAKTYYAWGDNTIPAGRQRAYADRYEYNEQYEIKDTGVNRWATNNTVASLMTTLPDTLNGCSCTDCQDITHKKYVVNTWISHYGDAYKAQDLGYCLRLDEVDTIISSDYAQLYIPYEVFEQAVKKIKAAYSDTNDYAGFKNYMKYWARNGAWNWIANTEESNTPLYIDASDDSKSQKRVKYTYLETKFWDEFNGTQSPLDGSAATAVGDSKGWYSTKQQQQ